MRKMGGFEDNMDSRVPSGSASSASGYSLRSRGSSTKISPFCPRSSSKLTQSIIRDHMLSHYKKVYSAKAAIDTSVPKSLLYSVKYNDQLKRGGLKNGVRPQSAHSLSQRSRASCSPAQSRLSLQYDDSPYQCSSRSLISTPRPSTSFHPKNTVYPNFTGDLKRPSSERRHRTLQTSLTQHSAYSPGDTALQNQLHYKGFQDPSQKTYGGDLLQKHAQRFTEGKPFTPKMLKTDKSSYLSKYRYYRAPQSTSQDSSHKHKDKSPKSTSNRDSTYESDEHSQGFTTDHDPSEDFDHSFTSALRDHSLTHKSRELDLAHAFPRVSYKGTKSPIIKCVDAEEEELKYLEFITAVTDDILSRGFISDGVVDRVINRHIDMNRYHLDEGKMRHLLEVLRKDLKEPCHSPINTLNFEREESHKLNSLLQKDDLEDTKEDTQQFQLVSNSAVEKSDSIDFSEPILTSTVMPESAKTFLADPIEINEEKRSISPHLSKHNSFSEADIHANQSEDENKEDSSQSEESDRLVKDLQDVATALESLNVSDQSHCDNEEAANVAISEDEF